MRLSAKKEGAKVEKLEADLEKVQDGREKDRIRYATGSARLQNQVEELSRKLEKQTSEQRGEEAELDLFTELRQIFQPLGDKIERIGRGIRGADIVHDVMDGTKLAGRIIYESKDTQDWSKEFIAKAKRYQTQYETPHVMIVSHRFPDKRQKGLCVEKSIPVVERCMAVSLAKIIRSGVLEIAGLRMSSSLRDKKSQELFDYIVGDRFGTRFREIAEGIASLRERQQKERTWHEDSWEVESKIHDRIDSRHRELGAQIDAIVRGRDERMPKIPARRANGGLGAASAV